MIVKTIKYVHETMPGDMLTPITMYTRLQGRKKMLFESNAKHHANGRYSFIALNPIGELYGDDKSSTYCNEQQKEIRSIPVVERLKNLLPTFEEKLPFSFFGGAIGYFSYELAYHFEKIGLVVNDPYDMPDVHVYFYEQFVVYDHLLEEVHIVALDLFQEGKTEAQLKDIVATMKQQLLTEQEVPFVPQQIDFKPLRTKEQFVAMVNTAKEHILRGDIFQVVLSQTFEADFNGDAFQLYRALRSSNPSPYMYFMQFDDYQIVGTSPESLVKVRDGEVITNPIAGTKKRGMTPQLDDEIAKELLQDDKELAEHKMLVDLGRNDIGRVSKVGSVRVTKYMTIEKYKHVMHIVSEVVGELRDELHIVDVLASALPAGTVSGAPKIRAMQIIHTLESRKRGVYAGAVGYLSATGEMDLALAIRTMLVKDEKAYVQAGAGVVYDSNAESEFEETLNKAKALLEVKG